ncbi:MAG TPA: hypothetical protein PKA58_19835 [Polyangium sp.]|nr:hypothetical protein [Polyangium sp.]
MKYNILVFSLLGLAIAGCGTDVQSGGQGGGQSSSSSSGTAGTGGDGGSMGTGGKGGAGGAASSSSGMGGSGGGACGFCDFTCCGDACTNLNNDINNCGACGKKCDPTTPYCDNGVCKTPPCNGAQCGPAGTCCGANCCMPGELCCNVPGPIGDMLGCHTPNANGTCPTGCTSCECASPDTLIATPTGEKPIASLAEGDLVYSVHHGAIVAVPIRRTQRNPVTNHFVLHVELESGRVLEISAGHPTADGNSFGDLKRGSLLGGIMVKDIQRIAYAHSSTYDILPDSETGTYFAAGALVGSTISKPAAASTP